MSIPTGWELILLLGVLVLLFGSTKLPTAARSIGQSLRIFKAETKGMRSDNNESAAPTVERPTTAVSQQPATQQPASQQPLPPSTAPRAATPVEEPQRGSDTSR